MDACAAAALLVSAAVLATAQLGRADEPPELEFDYRAVQLGEYSAVTAPTYRSESRTAAAAETATSALWESTPSSEFGSNETDADADETVKRFLAINARASVDAEFQRREVQVLTCCFAEGEEACDVECLEHFVASVHGGGGASNRTTAVRLCSALYGLLECHGDPRSAHCSQYCRCFSADPWADAAWGAASALFFVCTLLTLAVYLCVPRLRNLHGKCLASYLVAVLAGEAVATVASALVCGDPDPLVLAAVHYLTLARYCWVNLLCVDVYCRCRPFRSVRQQRRAGCLSPERRRFLCFSAAAWGGSALVFGALWVFQVEATPVIYTGIVFLLLAASCVPLLLTLARIWRTKRQTRKSCVNISKMRLNWFYLTSKLLCLSGAWKLLSVVLYFTVRGKPYYKWLFVVLKLEGPIVFFLFVCNVRVRGLIRKHLTNLEWINGEKSNENCSKYS
ncbi:G-protein coupled receptor Mth2-like [Schistocerca piceifrons]|uniref:G-protein coupled receptor Mth2-like n=1 Tax=Schistocerca piceifrons TaxID=274613 RepID=UPI001F5FBC46|nr:G-protein coupled receptor Mth2-like [Schistocerca piceifrons]